MSDKAFQSSSGGAPFPRSAREWMEKGMDPVAAEDRMRRDVFGHDYRVDAKGTPIEQGKGSALQPTAQHRQAIEIAETARSSRGMGWGPQMEGAFDPRIQDQIDRAVKAALAGAKPRKARGTGRKAKPAPEATS